MYDGYFFILAEFISITFYLLTLCFNLQGTNTCTDFTIPDCHLHNNLHSFNPCPNDASKLKEFADDNFKVNENGKKFSKR